MVKVEFWRHGKGRIETFSSVKDAAKAVAEAHVHQTDFCHRVNGSEDMAKGFVQAGSAFMDSRKSWWAKEDRQKAHAKWCAFCRQHA